MKKKDFFDLTRLKDLKNEMKILLIYSKKIQLTKIMENNLKVMISFMLSI
jgi:hypothetical protein